MLKRTAKKRCKQINEITLNMCVRDEKNLPIIEKLYEKGIGEALAAYWLDVADRYAAFGADMVAFMIKLAEREGSDDMPDRSKPEYEHFVSLLQSLTNYIAYESRETGDNRTKADADMLATLLEKYRSDKAAEEHMIHIYNIVSYYWLVLYDKVKVMNLLMEASRVQTKWADNPEVRQEFVSILNDQ